MKRHLKSLLVPVLAAAILTASCGKKPQGQVAPVARKALGHPLDLSTFTPRPVGAAFEGHPWITDLEVADLDGDGRPDIIACDAQKNEVVCLFQKAKGLFEEKTLLGTVAGPAHVEVADINRDGKPDLLVAGMGQILPSNEKTGTVTILENLGNGRFEPHTVLTGVSRVTYVGSADFNKDGKPDLIVGQFGYIEGEIRWMENKGDWNFEGNWLLDLPGTIHAPAADMDGDGNPDVVALVSQDSEEVHLFTGDGKGNFKNRILYGSTNRDYGSSGLSIGDVNQDGLPDIVYTNGDGFDYATPGTRPWHGTQWLENKGNGKFEFHRLGNFSGAYSPVVVDIDGDGDNDIVVCSGFNDWSDRENVCLAVYENEGGKFTLRPLSKALTHLVVVRAADLYGDGRIELLTGAFMFYPPFDRPSRLTLWEPRE